ncbi:MAG: YggS family pyridoxal phosphate-dependent enzyme [Gammaproteobacteria bacterium]|nr:YggS family pyridoxal phosphate-dependent enzyme [Gammaproteobacteria bacterium]
MHNIEKNLETVRERIARYAQAYQRSPQDITLLAVSKTKPVTDIEIALAAGQRDFGENYVQEAEQKILAMQGKTISWHYIGPIQSNKTRRISELFDWVHSVDRYKIARRLSEQRPSELPALNILLQVNIENEPSKSGIAVDEILALAQKIAELPRVRLRGLMAIPAVHDDFDQQREPLARMFQAYRQLQQHCRDCDTLSMGMSADMQAAIAEGATLVRIGTAIFGPRAPVKNIES